MKGFMGKWYVRILFLILLSLFTYYLFNLIGISGIILSVLAIFAFLDKILELLGYSKNKREEKIIEKIIERIPPSREILEEKEIKKSKKREEKLRKLINRLRSSIKEAGISVNEIIKSYGNPIKAILIFKFRERHKGKKSTLLKERMGKRTFC